MTTSESYKRREDLRRSNRIATVLIGGCQATYVFGNNVLCFTQALSKNDRRLVKQKPERSDFPCPRVSRERVIGVQSQAVFTIKFKGWQSPITEHILPSFCSEIHRVSTLLLSTLSILFNRTVYALLPLFPFSPFPSPLLTRSSQRPLLSITIFSHFSPISILKAASFTTEEK